MQLLKDFTASTPFALLGAFGLLGLADGFLTIPDQVQVMLTAWENVTRPIWDFLLGWIFKTLNLSFPNWLKDYLTVGVVHYGMFRRGWGSFNATTKASGQLRASVIAYILAAVAFWPLWATVFIIKISSSWLDPRRMDRIKSSQNIRDTLSRFGKKDTDGGFLPLSSQEQDELIDSIFKPVNDRLVEKGRKAMTYYLSTLVWFLIFVAVNNAVLNHWNVT